MGYTPPQDIDIGSEAKNRSSYNFTSTYIDKNNPANLSGKIESVEIWAKVDLTGVKVATFFVVSGNNLSTRSYEAIPGTITAGSKQTFEVNIDVEAGDYIGLFFGAGQIERTSSGAGGWYSNSGVDLIPCEDQVFNTIANRAYSIYGTGTLGSGELTIGEAFSIADSLVKNITKQLSEAFSVLDSKVTKITKSLGEAFSTVDSKLTKIVKALEEAFSVVDSLVKGATKQLAEAFSVADSKITKIAKSLSEAFSVVDSFVKTIILHFYEALTVKDSFKRFFKNLYSKVSKGLSSYTKTDKDTSTYTKTDKDVSDYTETDKDISDHTEVGKEKSDYIKKDKNRGEEL